MKRRKFLIVDDHPLFRMGLRGLLSIEYKDNLEIFEAADGKQAIEILTRHSIDCLLLDINMPGMNGLVLITYLKKIRLSVKIVVLTLYKEPSLVYHLLEMGVHGYLSKDHGIDNVKNAIDTVIKGGLFYPIEFDEKMKTLIQSGNVCNIKISEKEKEILNLMAQGLTGIEIAEATGYTKRTVETKRSRLEKRLRVKSAPALIHLAHRLGILT
jgi:DNA-binding NarL/FixJ family response regulator